MFGLGGLFSLELKSMATYFPSVARHEPIPNTEIAENGKATTHISRLYTRDGSFALMSLTKDAWSPIREEYLDVLSVEAMLLEHLVHVPDIILVVRMVAPSVPTT